MSLSRVVISPLIDGPQVVMIEGGIGPKVVEIRAGVTFEGASTWDELGGTANHVPFAITPAAVPTDEGTVSWNPTDHTLNLQTELPSVIQQVGQELLIPVKNQTGATLTDGTVVAITGSTGERVSVEKAIATSATHAEATIGLVTADIANGGDGYVTIFGRVRGLNTNALTEGAAVYVSETTAGALTNSKPTGENSWTIRVGWVEKKSGGEGRILVSTERMTASGTDITGGILLKTPVWDDMTFPSNGINPPGTADAPTRSTTTGMLEFSASIDNVIAGQVQFSHARKNSSSVRPHIHILCPTASASAVSRWKLELNKGGGGIDYAGDYGTYPESYTITITNPNNVRHVAVGSFPEISMIGIGESGLIMWKLTRLAGTDAADTDAMIVLQDIDFHYQVEKLGSTDEIPTP